MWAWLALAALAHPPTVSVVYVTSFDVDAMGDKVCPQTGFCDCTVRYEGQGTLVSSDANTATYKGTWAVAAGSCHDALMLWVPGDGEAYHTLRTTPDGQTLTEWIGHARAGDTVRFAADIKAKGQVFLYDFEAPLSDGVFMHSETEVGQIGPLGLKSTHSLTVVRGG